MTSIGNIESMKKALAAAEADLFVFCELYLTGYMVRDQVHRLAERLDGGSVSKISELAEEHGCGILFGMAREDDELPGVIKNSAVLVSEGRGPVLRQGAPGHLWSVRGRAYISPKEHAPTIMEFRGYRFGTCICYDLFHSEMARAYALGGAEALVCISASPYTSREFVREDCCLRGRWRTPSTRYMSTRWGPSSTWSSSEVRRPMAQAVTRSPNCPISRTVSVCIEIDRDELDLARRMGHGRAAADHTGWVGHLLKIHDLGHCTYVERRTTEFGPPFDGPPHKF